MRVGRWLKDLSIRDKETCGHFHGWMYWERDARPCRITYETPTRVWYALYYNDRWGDGNSMSLRGSFEEKFDTNRDRLLARHEASKIFRG